MVRTRTSPILGPDGRPIEVALLSEEISAPVRWGARSIPLDAVATGLTPERLAQLMRDAAGGQARSYLTLAMEMEERYLHYASQLQTRRLAFDAIPAAVTAPAGVPAKIVDAVQGLVDDPSFRDMCSDLTDAVSKGYSAIEIIWDYRDGLLKPVAYKHRDPRFFQFDPVSLSELRLIKDGLIEGVPLPPAKFIVHTPRTRTGIPIRRGLARLAAWAFLVQSFTLQDWAAFAETYGVPFRTGKYHPAATDADKRALLRALMMIANDGAGIFPSGMEVEFHTVPGSHGEAVFGALLDYVDRQVSKAVVGQTMTADDGSSLGQAKIHNEVRMDILRADARGTGATVSRDLVQPFVALNFGPQAAYPTVEFLVTEPEDITALSKAVKALVPLGLKVGQREMREKIGLSEPSGEDELLGAPRQPETQPPAGPETLGARPAGHVLGCRCRSCLKPARLAAEVIDEVDELVDGAMQDFERIADPLLDPFRRILDEASSLEDALERLAQAGPDGAALIEVLARKTAIARGLGDVRD